MHTPEEDMGIPKILPTFFIRNSPKIKHFFGRKGKEDMGIPKNFDRLLYKNGNSQFFYCFWHKKLGIPIFFFFFFFFLTSFRIPIFKVKIPAWEFQNF